MDPTPCLPPCDVAGLFDEVRGPLQPGGLQYVTVTERTPGTTEARYLRLNLRFR